MKQLIQLNRFIWRSDAKQTIASLSQFLALGLPEKLCGPKGFKKRTGGTRTDNRRSGTPRATAKPGIYFPEASKQARAHAKQSRQILLGLMKVNGMLNAPAGFKDSAEATDAYRIYLRVHTDRGVLWRFSPAAFS